MLTLFALLFLVALVIALALFLAARRQRAQAGMPYGVRIVYADTGAWQKVERPLVSWRYGLIGKPDYIVEERGTMIPVEVKPSRVARAPRESDVLQLAAYTLLVEEDFGTAATYGLLKYRDVVFRVEVTNELRAHLLDVLAAMRRDLDAQDVARNHNEPHRCRACGYRAECGQTLR